MPKSKKLPAAALDQRTTEEKAHAEFSASGSDRWLNCPGSLRLSKQAPPVPDSPYAEEGTQAHACVEFFLRNRADFDAALKAARERYSDEMIEHAVDALNYIEQRLVDMPGAELLIEKKVDSSPFTMTGQFGTLDVALVEFLGRLVVMDYKYGAGHAVDLVDGKGRANSQLVYYGLALSHEYGHLFESIELVVIQPRAFHEAGPIRSHTMTMDELHAWHQVFRDGVMETSDPKAPLRDGPWCRWCPAKPICPKLKDEALVDARVSMSEMGSVVVTAVPPARLSQLPNLETVLNGVERLEVWCKAVKAHAYHVLEQGGTIPGYKLVDRRASRKWRDKRAVEFDLKDVKGAYSAPELLSPAQAEKALRKAGWGAKDVREFMAEATLKESSGRQLVRDDDQRSAVVGGARAVFSDIDEMTLDLLP